MKRKPWTEADTIEARRLFRELGTYKAVGKAMRRSPTTVIEWINDLRGNGRPRARDHTIVPESVLAERERRMHLAPRDYTAAFFGDPLPGYSALDRIREPRPR